MHNGHELAALQNRNIGHCERRRQRLIGLGTYLMFIGPGVCERLFRKEFEKDYPERYRRMDKWDRQHAAYSRLMQEYLIKAGKLIRRSPNEAGDVGCS